MPSIIDAEKVSRTASRPIDAEVKRIFLDELERTGSYASAAVKARPHLRSRKSAASVFQDLESRDPEFKAQVSDAYAQIAAEGERLLRERAFDGVVEKIKYATDPKTGEVLMRRNSDTMAMEPIIVEQTTKHDNNLLVLVTRNALRRLDPDAYTPPTAKKNIHVSGGTMNVSANVDLDRIVEAMPYEVRVGFLKAIQEAKVLASNNPEPDPAEALDVE